jgi:hypothetical protein
MPISNPIIQGLNVTVIQGTDITLAVTDPIAPPSEAKKLWFNSLNQHLFLAIATQSVSDWVAIGGTSSPVDAASILNKILVQNGEVLTTDTNVIFED